MMVLYRHFSGHNSPAKANISLMLVFCQKKDVPFVEILPGCDPLPACGWQSLPQSWWPPLPRCRWRGCPPCSPQTPPSCPTAGCTWGRRSRSPWMACLQKLRRACLETTIGVFPNCRMCLRRSRSQERTCLQKPGRGFDGFAVGVEGKELIKVVYMFAESQAGLFWASQQAFDA